MITPKTNWVSTDYYNVEDHNRIVSNLNELLSRYNLTPLLSVGAVGELLTEEHLLGIVRSCNAVLEAAGYKTAIQRRNTWFDADDLNKTGPQPVGRESRIQRGSGIRYRGRIWRWCTWLRLISKDW